MSTEYEYTLPSSSQFTFEVERHACQRNQTLALEFLATWLQEETTYDSGYGTDAGCDSGMEATLRLGDYHGIKVHNTGQFECGLATLAAFTCDGVRYYGKQAPNGHWFPVRCDHPTLDERERASSFMA